jgi:magnesium transporter
MISKYAYKKLTWIDLESPTKEEVLTLKDEYELPPLVADELYEPTTRSKVDKYDTVIFLILHFPVLDGKGKTEREIDFAIGKDFIITTHYETIDPIHEFSKIFEVNSILDKSNMGEHAGFLFFYIMRELYHHTLIELDALNRSLISTEKEIFEGDEGTMVEVISGINRKIVDCKQALRFHGEVLKSFESAGTEFFGKEFMYYLQSISGEYNKVQNILEGHKEILKDLRETNDSLLANKTNEAMRTLTVMNFVMLPLTLIAGIFGMNASFLFIHNLSDFFMIIGGMALVGYFMFLYFRKKRWI